MLIREGKVLALVHQNDTGDLMKREKIETCSLLTILEREGQVPPQRFGMTQEKS